MTTLTINLNSQLKAKVQKKVKKEGMTLTALISRFLDEYLKDEWELRISHRAEKRLLEAMKQSREDLASGKAKLYDNVDQMFEDILKEPDEI